MKKYLITYTNGNTLTVQSYDIEKVETGYILYGGLNTGLTFLSNKYIVNVVEI